MYRLKNIIELEILDFDQKYCDKKGINVNLVIIFDNKFCIFEDLIHDSVKRHIEFWRELLEDNPDIKKLQ